MNVRCQPSPKGTSDDRSRAPAGNAHSPVWEIIIRGASRRKGRSPLTRHLNRRTGAQCARFHVRADDAT
ncbi:hypothetical protein EMIT0111MI5_290014 [Burkholderia sp. IT-111MI5]